MVWQVFAALTSCAKLAKTAPVSVGKAHEHDHLWCNERHRQPRNLRHDKGGHRLLKAPGAKVFTGQGKATSCSMPKGSQRSSRARGNISARAGGGRLRR